MAVEGVPEDLHSISGTGEWSERFVELEVRRGERHKVIVAQRSSSQKHEQPSRLPQVRVRTIPQGTALCAHRPPTKVLLVRAQCFGFSCFRHLGREHGSWNVPRERGKPQGRANKGAGSRDWRDTWVSKESGHTGDGRAMQRGVPTRGTRLDCGEASSSQQSSRATGAL